MRILFHTIENKKKFKEIINYLEENLLAKVDFLTDYEEAEYCVDIRHYDYIFVDFNNKYKNKYLNFFKNCLNHNKNSHIFVFGNKLENINLDIYSKYNTINFIDKDLSTKDIKKLIESNTSNIIEHDIIKVNVKEKKVWVINKNKEDIEISFKKRIDFYVFLYFMRHYKKTINITNLLDATCEEPELTKDSIIESSISSLRKTFKEIIGVNPIKAFKKVGYEFSV